MDTEFPDARFQTPFELAGRHYDQMITSMEATATFLSSPDHRVRLAAILLFVGTWKRMSDPRLIRACEDLAVSDADDSVRVCAIHSFGHARSFSKCPNASRLLADLVMTSSNGIEVQRAAYLALREVQYGMSDTSFDELLRSTISTVKDVFRQFPQRFPEERMRNTLVPPDSFPDDRWESAEEFWESADRIDFDFVARFATETTR